MKFNIINLLNQILLNQDDKVYVTNTETDNTYQVNKSTAKKGMKSGKYVKPSKQDIQDASKSNKEPSDAYQKVSSDQQFNQTFMKQYGIKKVLSLNQIVDQQTNSKITKLCQQDQNLKQQLNALLRYMSMDQKALKSGDKLTSKFFINSKLVGAGPLASTMGELMVLVNTKLPNDLSKSLYQNVLSNIKNYPALYQKTQSKANPSWWKSAYKTSNNIKKFMGKNNLTIKSCIWDNKDLIRGKFGDEVYNKIYGNGTTADMFVQTSQGKLIPVSLKKGGAARLGTMSPGKVTRKLIQPYDVGGSKYIATQRDKLWQNFFKDTDMSKHFSKVADIVENMTQQDFAQAQKYKKDFYAILKLLKKQGKLDQLRSLNSRKDIDKLLKTIPKFAQKGSRGINKLLMNSVDIQLSDPKCQKVFNQVINVAKKSANKMMQVMFQSQEGKKMIMQQLKNILPFSQLFQKDLIIADPDTIVSKDTFKSMKIDSIQKLGQKIKLQQDQNGNLYIVMQVYNKKDDTIKSVKVAKLSAIESGVGYANNIVIPITQHKQFHNLMQENSMHQRKFNVNKLLLKSL